MAGPSFGPIIWFLLITCVLSRCADGFTFVVSRQKRKYNLQTLSATSAQFGFRWSTSFDKIFFGPIGRDPIKKKRDLLKKQIIEYCDLPESSQKRSLVEGCIDELAVLSPIRDTASSQVLQKRWKVLWTTEKEINFFLERGWATEIFQTIQGKDLQNMIPFVKGGGLGVKGTLEIDKINPLRTMFRFDVATLDLGRFGSYNLPPVGEGWFDTLYLDEELRIDKNSRNDILICELWIN